MDTYTRLYETEGVIYEAELLEAVKTSQVCFDAGKEIIRFYKAQRVSRWAKDVTGADTHKARMIQIVQCIADGMRVKGIAEKYNWNVRTVENWIMKDLTDNGCMSQAELVATYIRGGLIK